MLDEHHNMQTAPSRIQATSNVLLKHRVYHLWAPLNIGVRKPPAMIVYQRVDGSKSKQSKRISLYPELSLTVEWPSAMPGQFIQSKGVWAGSNSPHYGEVNGFSRRILVTRHLPIKSDCAAYDSVRFEDISVSENNIIRLIGCVFDCRSIPAPLRIILTGVVNNNCYLSNLFMYRLYQIDTDWQTS